MRRRVINVWSTRDDPKRVNRRVASVVMLLDVIHVHCAIHTGDLEYVLRVVEQIRILPQELLVALEVDRINLHAFHVSTLLSFTSSWFQCLE